MLGEIGKRSNPGRQVTMFGRSTALAAIGDKFARFDADRSACLASVAIGTIGENATAAKATLDQFRINVSVDQMRGRGNLRARLKSIQIAAWIWRSGIELQSGEGQIF